MKLSRINKTNLLYAIMFIPFFEPSYIGHNVASLHILYRAAYYLDIIAIIIMYFGKYSRSKKWKSWPVILFSLYSFSLVLSSIINDGEIVGSLQEAAGVISFVMLCDITLKKSTRCFLNSIYPVIYILVVINFATMIIYPRGMYLYVMDGAYYWASNNNWFLGLENAMIVYLLPTVVFTYLIDLDKKSRWSKFNCMLITFICIYIPVIRWKATSIFCFGVFFLLCWLAYYRLSPNILNARTYTIANVVIFVILVIIGFRGGIVAYITETLLHKGSTLGVRTTIWGQALELISQKPVFGYGAEIARVVTSKMKYDSTHNEYMWLFYRGGIVHFTFFAILIGMITKQLYNERVFLSVKIVAAGLFVIMLMWQTEAIFSTPLIMFIVFCFHFSCEERNYLRSLEKYPIKKGLVLRKHKKRVRI